MISGTSIRFAYQKTQLLFDGLDILFPKTGALGLLGKNGAGKSTLLKILAGLFEVPQGTVTLDGIPVRPRKPEVFGRLFFVPEDFQLPKVHHNDWAKIWKNFYPNFDQQQFQNYLKLFEVQPARMDQQSFGQQKKSLLAFAMASGCPYLFLDEPSNGLDIDSQRKLKKSLADLSQSRCVVISTHHVRSFGEIFDHLVFIDAGQVILNHSLKTLQNHLVVSSNSDNGPALFSESSPDRFLYPASQFQGSALEISEELEFFFSATISAKEKVRACLPS